MIGTEALIKIEQSVISAEILLDIFNKKHKNYSMYSNQNNHSSQRFKISVVEGMSSQIRNKNNYKNNHKNKSKNRATLVVVLSRFPS